MPELTQKNVNWLLLLTNPQKKYVNMRTNVFWRDSLISASAVIDTPVRIVNLLRVILIHVRMDQNVVLLNKSSMIQNWKIMVSTVHVLVGFPVTDARFLQLLMLVIQLTLVKMVELAALRYAVLVIFMSHKFWLILSFSLRMAYIYDIAIVLMDIMVTCVLLITVLQILVMARAHVMFLIMLMVMSVIVALVIM